MNLNDMREDLQKLSLEELLRQLEIDLSRVGHNSPDACVQMLLKMDQVFLSLEEMERKGNAVKAEAAQFEFIARGLETNARSFLKDMGGKVALQQARERAKPAASLRWWFLDQAFQNQMRDRLRRTGLTLGGLVAGLILLVVIYNRFFAPDPVVAKRYGLQMDADQSISQGDLSGALNSVNQALELVPQDGGMLIMRGVLYDRLGRKADAQVEFMQAESILNNDEQFLLQRAEDWMKVGATPEGLKDVQDCIREYPNSAQGYYYYGRINELTQNYTQAIDAYNQASALAEKQGKIELNATIRMTMAMLMQNIPAMQPTAVATPTR